MYQSNERQIWLDGLRGVAAVVVAIAHFNDAFNGRFLFKTLNIFPLFKFFLDGQLAVALFFLISGYVMLTFFNNKHGNTTQKLAYRYLRLTIPMLASAILITLLFWSKLLFNQKAAIITGSGVGDFWSQYKPVEILNHVFIDSFINHGQNFHLRFVNPVFWTMGWELFGSALILILCKSKFPKLLILVIASICLMSWMFLFVVGFMIATNQFPSLNKKRPWINDLSVIIVLSLHTYFTSGYIQNYFPYIANIIGNDLTNRIGLNLYASTLFYFLTTSQYIKQIFTWKIAQFLGYVSFGLYLTHMAILGSLASFLVFKFHLSSTQTFIPYFASTLLAALLFEWPIRERILPFLKNRIMRDTSD